MKRILELLVFFFVGIIWSQVGSEIYLGFLTAKESTETTFVKIAIIN